MHELGIVFHIINSLESVGRENQLTQVANVTPVSYTHLTLPTT